MLSRRGARIVRFSAPPGETPDPEEIEAALRTDAYVALFATHVDTSTGVRICAESLAKAARRHDVLSVFDGVCATAAERFMMEGWGADVYLTASQKAIGLPAGLGLMVVSERALARRRGLATAPPMSMDWLEWLPIMKAYEERRPSYFSTPATNLIAALAVGLEEILSDEYRGLKGMEARFQRHEDVGRGMRAAWSSMGLKLLPRTGLEANTLSAVCYPDGCDASVVGAIRDNGVIVAGGLHPDLKSTYFRVGHMGHVLLDLGALERTVTAVGDALLSQGYDVDVSAACAAANGVWG